MVMSESLVVLVAALVLWTAYAFVRSPTTRNVVFFGLACGAGALTRTEMALLFPLLLVPLAFLARSLAGRQRFKLAVVGCVVGGVLIAPWVLYNLTRFDKPVLLSTGIGQTLAAEAATRSSTASTSATTRCASPARIPRGSTSRYGTARHVTFAIDYLEDHKSRHTARRRRARRSALGRVQARADHRVRLVDRRTRPRARRGSPCSATTR